MRQRNLPALFMRGGTSKGLIFDQRVLPAALEERNRILLAAMGSPDPNGRQLDGMGGGLSSLSKVCIIGAPTRLDADIDYTFGQVAIDEARIDYAGNCGNMISAVGPAALEFGYVEPTGREARIRIHNTNTGQIIVSRFPLEEDRLRSHGTFAIDGVAGTGAPIELAFNDPGGSKTGALLPTGNPVDSLILPDGSSIRASIVDAANPCIFVAATDLRRTAAEHPTDLAEDIELQGRLEAIRQAGSVRMGLTSDLTGAIQMPSIPKVAMVAAPGRTTFLDGKSADTADVDILVRMISMGQPHRAIPMTGAICLAVACRIEDSIPNQLAQPTIGPLRLAHPSGIIPVSADVERTTVAMRVRTVTIYRTARILFSGCVYFRA